VSFLSLVSACRYGTPLSRRALRGRSRARCCLQGVPKFFRWLSERYPLLNQPVKLRGAPQIDNLVRRRRPDAQPRAHPSGCCMACHVARGCDGGCLRLALREAQGCPRTVALAHFAPARSAVPGYEWRDPQLLARRGH